MGKLCAFAEASMLSSKASSEFGTKLIDPMSNRFVANGNVRITIQLIDGKNETRLWSETDTREFSQIFDIETDIARQVRLALRSELTGSEDSLVARRLTKSIEAYIHYLRARGILGDPTPVTRRSQSDAYQAALDETLRHDPEFAIAHAMQAVDLATALMRSYISLDQQSERLARVAQKHIEAPMF